MKGTVKSFTKKGYGFIVPEKGGKDVFVHHSDIVMDGYRELHEGQQVSFDMVETDKGMAAKNVKPMQPINEGA